MFKGPDSKAKRAAYELAREFQLPKKTREALAVLIERVRDAAILGGPLVDELVASEDALPRDLVEKVCGRSVLLAVDAVRDDAEGARRGAKQRRDLMLARIH